MDLTQLLSNTLNNDAMLELFSQNLNEDKDKVAKAAGDILPALMGGMSQNIQSKDGLASLLEAIGQHENDAVDKPKSFFENLDLKDGEKILGHILGTNKSKVEKEVSKSSGLSLDSTSKLMVMLAPLLMGLLGKQKKSDSNFGADLLMKMLAGAGASSILTNILKGQLAPKKSKSKDDNPLSDLLGKLLK